MFQRRTGTVGFKQGHNKFGRKIYVDLSCPVSNGGFETGDLSSWSGYTLNYTCVRSAESGGAFKGTYYGRLYGYRHLNNPAWGSCRLYYTTTCNAKDQKLHMAYRAGGNTNFGNKPCQLVVWIGYSVAVSYQFPITPTWTELDFDLSAGGTWPQGKIQFSVALLDYLKNAWIDIDDVYFHY